jgi:S1-C subfamily serine protease
MTAPTRRIAPLALAALALAGCGSSSGGDKSAATSKPATAPSKVEVVKQIASERPSFDPGAIYDHDARSVVTVVSIFPGSGLGDLLGGGGGGGGGGTQEGLGSGFVISEDGEIATNAHVITNGKGASTQRAKEVYVKFGDGNQVPAKIVGADPNEDVGLIKVDPKDLNLKALPLGTSSGLVVGSPVAAIGSPFGEAQSLSVGVISALNRSIDSLTNFSISGAIQTDAAINHGNSGGPLVDTKGRVIGINSQIQSTGGGGEGVGFSVPIDGVKRSLDQLRSGGKATYAYLGVSSTPIYPQLATHFKLPVTHGAWLQTLTPGGPAEQAGLRSGHGRERFQVTAYAAGGDIITKFDGRDLRREEDLSALVATKRPGDEVTLEIYRDGKKREVKMKLGTRPGTAPKR